MADLTEAEIFSCLAENFRLAAENCDKLARTPRRGPIYKELRDQLKLIEGAARQAAYWRSDSRWLKVGLDMAKCHRSVGDWLRGPKDPVTGQHRPIPPGQLNPLMKMMADSLRNLHRAAEDLRTKATGTTGTILPEAYRIPKPMRKTASGLIIPAGVQ